MTDGPKIQLDGFPHISVQFPYQWDAPDRVSVNNSKTGKGSIYSRDYAVALAKAILRATGEGVSS